MRRTLSTHREGGFITSRGYCQSKAGGLSSRRLRDVALAEHIRELHAKTTAFMQYERFGTLFVARGLILVVNKPHV